KVSVRFSFFFQAEDGIRDYKVTGVQTCALPIFWWSNTEWQSPEWKAKKLDSDPSAFVKIVFGSDNGLDGIESVVNQYHALFEACGIPANTRKMIMGGTLSNMLGLPDGH